MVANFCKRRIDYEITQCMCQTILSTKETTTKKSASIELYLGLYVSRFAQFFALSTSTRDVKSQPQGCIEIVVEACPLYITLATRQCHCPECVLKKPAVAYMIFSWLFLLLRFLTLRRNKAVSPKMAKRRLQAQVCIFPFAYYEPAFVSFSQLCQKSAEVCLVQFRMLYIPW